MKISDRLIELETPVERAILVAAPPNEMDARLADEHLAELVRLLDTAGGEVVDTLTQRIDAPNPRFYIGKGKADELKALVESAEADLVVFDDELKPDQAKNLEDFLGVRVMDRPELILDIFATRARTREAKLQVELAQLQYLLPRLKRMWSHLSRIRGGIGLRGPGETQLETDRRLINVRISALKRELKGVTRSRETQRKGRGNLFSASLVGYTNAGKSSLLRALSGSKLFVEDRLFATLDSATRTVDLGSGHEALLTDTVGFIRKLPHHLIASFRSTLEEARESDLLLHVIDASHPDREEQRTVVDEVLRELGLDEHPQILVFNKIDRLTHAEETALRERVRANETIPAVFVSALDPRTLHEVTDALKARVRARFLQLDLRLPAGDGEILAELYREGEVLSIGEDGTVRMVTARVTEAMLGRLRARKGVEIVSGAPPLPRDPLAEDGTSPGADAGTSSTAGNGAVPGAEGEEASGAEVRRDRR